MNKRKMVKKKGELRRSFHGWYHVVIREHREDRFLGSFRDYEWEQLQNGERIRSCCINGEFWKSGLKIWMKRDLDDDLGRKDWVWVLTIREEQIY